MAALVTGRRRGFSHGDPRPDGAGQRGYGGRSWSAAWGDEPIPVGATPSPGAGSAVEPAKRRRATRAPPRHAGPSRGVPGAIPGTPVPHRDGVRNADRRPRRR